MSLGTIKLDDIELRALREALVAEVAPGVVGLTLPRTLNRMTYLKVAKAAEALGCRWNKKARALVADGQTFEQLDEALAQALDLGEVVDQDKAMQFFETPEKLALRLIAAVGIQPSMRVLEPSCGRCAIARQLPLGVDHLALVELDMRHRTVIEGFQSEWGGDCDASIGYDFLQVEPRVLGAFDAVVMNPPFSGGQAIAHIAHALEFLRPGGKLAAIAPVSVGFRQDARHRRFRELIAANGGSIEPLPEGSFEPTTSVRTVLVTATKSSG